MTTLNWKRWNDNGGMTAAGKTHLIGVDSKTACGKVIPKARNVEVEYFDSYYHDCKACSKAYAKNPDIY